MKKHAFLALFFVLAAAFIVGAFGSETRTWTVDKTPTEAEFVGMSPDGASVVLKTKNGALTVLREKLSDADRAWLDALPEDAAHVVGARKATLVPTPPETQTWERVRVFIAAASEYADGTGDLKYSENDAQAVKKIFVSLGADEEKDVVYLTTHAARHENQPSKTNIEVKFKRFVDSLKPGDFAVVYLCGHGLQFKDSDDAYFVPEDFYRRKLALDEPGGEEKNPWDLCVSINKMMEKLADSNALVCWTIVDACRITPNELQNAALGARTPNASTPESIKKIDNVPKKIALFQSCQPGTTSFEGGFGKAEAIWNGLFTLSLTEAFDPWSAPADANGDGKITFFEICDYVTRATDEKARKYYERSQTPVLTYDKDQNGDFVVFEAKASKLQTEYANQYGAKFKLITPGSFMMGDSLSLEEIKERWPNSDVGQCANARPRRRVTISKPFYIGVYEVTVEEYGKFVEAARYSPEADQQPTAWSLDEKDRFREQIGLTWNNPGFEQTDRNPVVCVSYDDAQAYCDWLNENLPDDFPKGFCYRLPTEAEWEYVARAGSTNSFFWGDSDDAGLGYVNGAGKESSWGAKWANAFPFSDGYEFTCPVDAPEFKPNPWGVYHMLGNANEWVADWYWSDYYETAPSVDPPGPETGSERVVRGGSWYTTVRGCRCADRNKHNPTIRYANVGFRVVIAPDDGVQHNGKSTVDKTVPKAPGELLPEYTNRLGAKFNRIHSGNFIMGDTQTPEEIQKQWGGEGDGVSNAQRRHEVTISKDFYMGVYEVTVGDFKKFVDATDYKTTAEIKGSAYFPVGTKRQWTMVDGLSWKDPGFPQTDRDPVVCVSYVDVEAYVDWLNATLGDELPAGFQYRLPTEAQWEYCARAGTDTIFFWGDDEAEGKGYLNTTGLELTPWGTHWSNPFSFEDGYAATCPVDAPEFKPNPWGLYHMLGNVYEWTSDWYDKDYYANSPAIDPAGPKIGTYRVVRGGSWSDSGRSCRSARRSWHGPLHRSIRQGFRLVVASVEEAQTPTARPGLLARSWNDSETRPAGARKTLTINGFDFDFRWIPPGEFVMGSDPHESDRQPDETQHSVVLSRGFWLMETELTQKLWQAVTGENPSDFKFEDQPVERINWADCQAFIEKLNSLLEASGIQVDGLRFRMPTESEWEYACRAGSKGPYNVDGAALGSLGWYGKNNGGPRTHPVAQKRPNAWGLYDMHGGVLEWCADFYGPYPEGIAQDPTGPKTGNERVARSGGWGYDPEGCRSASRRSLDPNKRYRDVGLRLAFSSAPSDSKPAEIRREAEDKIPQEYTDRFGAKFVLIPAGSFVMGGSIWPYDAVDRWLGKKLDSYIAEFPLHNATLPKSFYMGVYEVTVQEFQAFVEATGYQTTAEKDGYAFSYDPEVKNTKNIKGANWRKPGFTQTPRDPVVCVSYDDALAYIAWLNESPPADIPADFRYRLPTECEWEYACRAGTSTIFFWGDDEADGKGYVNAVGKDETPWGFTLLADAFPFADGYGGTCPVDAPEFKPNPWGLYHMLGNATELCSDWYSSDYYYHSPSESPTGPSDGVKRIFRGGSWLCRVTCCRSSARSAAEPTFSGSLGGFRLVLGPAPGPLATNRTAPTVKPLHNSANAL